MKLLLILISIVALGAVIGAVVIGVRTFDDTVVDKPYEHGLAYDTDHHEKISSGWNIAILNKDLFIGKNDVQFSVTDRDNIPVSDIEVSVLLSRPASGSYDMTYRATAAGKGQFGIIADLPLYGYWNAKIRVKDRDNTVTFDRTLFAKKKQQ